MSKQLQQDYSHDHAIETDRRIIRWFFIILYSIALLSSIAVSAIIAIATKSPLPAVIPGTLLLAMRPIVRWAFSQPATDKQDDPP